MEYFTFIGVEEISDCFMVFFALPIYLLFYQSNFTLIKASFVKSFVRAWESFATAKSSLLSLYKPTVVGNVWGLLMKLEYIKVPVDPEIIDGFVV